MERSGGAGGAGGAGGELVSSLFWLWVGEFDS
jgi:hypothetical protein